MKDSSIWFCTCSSSTGGSTSANLYKEGPLLVTRGIAERKAGAWRAIVQAVFTFSGAHCTNGCTVKWKIQICSPGRANSSDSIGGSPLIWSVCLATVGWAYRVFTWSPQGSRSQGRTHNAWEDFLVAFCRHNHLGDWMACCTGSLSWLSLTEDFVEFVSP